MTNPTLEQARLTAKCAPPPQTEMVRVRDGLRLATDIYLPSGTGPWPVIVERTPYGKECTSNAEIALDDRQPLTRVEVANYYRARGFAVVMQDVRGRYGSEGQFSKYVNEAQDGFDCYNWILEQNWCDGMLCTIGLSYGGHTQIAAACAGAPGIASMIIDTGGLLNAMKYSLRFGGAFELKQLTWLLRHAKIQAELEGTAPAVSALKEQDVKTAVFEGDWRPGASPLSAMPDYEQSLFDMWNAQEFEKEWQSPATCAENWLDKIPDIPILLIGSWNDPYASSMCELHDSLTKRMTVPPSLIMGPWLHGKRSLTQVGDIDFSPASTIDRLVGTTMLEARANWFHHVLSGTKNPIPTRINLYQMQIGPDDLALSSDVKGNLNDNGKWIGYTKRPRVLNQEYQACSANRLEVFRADNPKTEQFFEFTTNIKDPFPTLGGAITSGGHLMSGGMFQVQKKLKALRAFERPDCHAFVSSPLTNALSFIGTPEVCATVKDSDGPFDLVAWLFHCTGRGRPDRLNWTNITDGIQRCQSKQTNISVTLMSSSFNFQRGARIGLLLTTSNFPRFDLAGQFRMPGLAREASQDKIVLHSITLTLPSTPL